MNKDLSAFREQHDAIQVEFTRQAPSWGRDEIDADLLWAVDRLGLEPHFEVLDVAGGTGLLSRAIAPHVKNVVAVDITPEMLAHGRRQVDRERIANVRFEMGAAEDLPYPSESFDMVATRFTVHHFQRPDVVIGEMRRVCRHGGRIAVIDIVSPEDEKLAARYNHFERLRDPTHTRALSPSELEKMIEAGGVRGIQAYSRDVANALGEWLDRTQTAGASREEILDAIREELGGGAPTGMRPFREAERLMFLHAWSVIVGLP